MTQDDEKRIFLFYSATRLIGLAVFILGVAIAFTDLVQPEGSPLIGGLLAVLGAVDAVVAPPMIRKAMEKRIDGKK